MAALTLAQMAQTEEGRLRKGIYSGLHRQGVIADILKFRSTNGVLNIKGLREDEVIQPDWIALGGAITSKTANVKPISASVYEMAVHLDIPEPIHTNSGDQVADGRSSTVQTRAAIKGAAYELNDVFFNGDQAVNANQPNGLNRIVATLGSDQTVGATEIDVSDLGTAAEQTQVIMRLLDAHSRVDGGKPTHAFINRQAKMILQAIFMEKGLLGDHHNWVSDTFKVEDRRRTFATPATKPSFVFDDVPYYDIGNKTDQTSQIIGNTYAEGGSAAGTRIFYIKQDEMNFEGLQAEALDVKEIGLLEDTDVRRWRLKWLPGWACWGAQSIVKVQGIKVAA